ncbi:unnamed protein product [Parnassius apollo]|uniref:(apollo) hypothetical protein n=1 Tax=Parnassius apollo TaxID=110799 RepID=A0A8S3WKD9_PARAO|nr:unnamed protein product [Parnassius apollo]
MRFEKSISLQEELQESLAALKKPNRSTNSANSLELEILIKKEMNLHEAGGVKGELLEFVHNCLSNVVQTSVEAERAFSAAGVLGL